MLCASEQVSAQDAHRPSHSLEDDQPLPRFATYVTRKPLLHDPKDPTVLTEYKELVQQWTTQHVFASSSSSAALATETDSSSSAASSVADYASRETRLLHFIDRFLDEQWVDSQHIMQCAQAWNTRDTLDQMEAIRTVNILGLRMMQRLLQARQELSTAFDVKDNVTFDSSSLSLSPLLPRHQTKEQQRSSLTSLADEQDQEMHAPLLRRLDQTNRSSDQEMGIIWSPGKLERRKQEEKKTTTTTTTSLSPRPLRLVPSPSAPNCTLSRSQQQQQQQQQDEEEKEQYQQQFEYEQQDYCMSGGFQPAVNYHRYYPRQIDYGTTSSKVAADDNISSSSDESYGDTGYWKSWFSNGQSSNSTNSNSNSNNNYSSVCVFCNYPVIKKSLSAGDAEHTQPLARSSSCSSTSYHSAHRSPHQSTSDNNSVHQSSTSSSLSSSSSDNSRINSVPEELDEDDLYTALIQNYTHSSNSVANSSNNNNNTTNIITRSESSISAFRPISKNLAPRCVPPPMPIPTSPQMDQHCRSFVANSEDAEDKVIPETSSMPVLTKSRSFPTKPFSRKLTDKSSVKDNKNSVVRSFVSKKVSLTKLFAGAKK